MAKSRPQQAISAAEGAWGSPYVQRFIEDEESVQTTVIGRNVNLSSEVAIWTLRIFLRYPGNAASAR